MSPAQAARLIDAFSPLSGRGDHPGSKPRNGYPGIFAGVPQGRRNRLSIGVQTARDDSLKALGRPHTAQQARTALEAAHAAGFENLSGDIMMALPNYSRDEFDETMKLIAGRRGPHFPISTQNRRGGPFYGTHLPDCPQRMSRQIFTFMP